MNSNQLEGNWNQLKGTIREKFGKLTDDDMEAIAGKKDQFVGKLQERYGYSKEQAQREADTILRGQQHSEPPRTHAAGSSSDGAGTHDPGGGKQGAARNLRPAGGSVQR